MNVPGFLLGLILLLGGIISLLGSEDMAQKMHRFWNRPHRTGRFAWTDTRLFEPSLPATRMLLRAFGAGTAAVGLAVMAAGVFFLEPASVNVSNVPGILLGIVLFLGALYFMFKKETLAQRISRYWNQRPATARRSTALNVDAVRTALWLMGLAIGAVGLALIVVSMGSE